MNAITDHIDTRRIIGIMGNARAGKDTIAGYLSQHRFVRIGLADPMKRFCAEVFGFTDEQLYGDARDKPDHNFPREQLGPDAPGGPFLTPRYALQLLGTEWGRHCYRDLWIDYGIRVAVELLAGCSRYTVKEGLVVTEKDTGICPGVVFSDLRFRNEFDAVKRAGGVLCRVKRPGLQQQVGIAGHVSEEEQKRIPDSEFDFIFDNDKEGDLSYLFDQVDRLLLLRDPRAPYSAGA